MMKIWKYLMLDIQSIFNIIFLHFLLEYCPPGWHSTRSTCMIAVESDTTLTTYEDAKNKCKEIDPIAYPAEPYNQYLQDQLSFVLSNSSLTETEFWIGKFL